MQTERIIKASIAWMSLAYVICYGAVAIWPGLRPWFMLYALHTKTEIGENVMTATNFFTGLLWWNALTAGGVWLFLELYNRIKD